ncbi:hypothetical protein QR680_005523 [Steinernema hermaphroditum]|uniref:Receptor ligand binding region domain-containing protein n=1 Tax=Steinernema hermaphroditum TaxID=289476 RepID=A0AA39HTE0_9BILA|nr:hypothetical protein QR680_005523 [Steinernema hermaphroditum]
MRPCFVFFFVALAVATISTGEDDDLLSIYVNATIQRAPVETTKFAEVSTTGATTPPPFGAAGPLKTQEAVVVVLSTLLATETETNTTQKIPPAELQTTKTPNAERVEETKTLVASTPTKSESSERTSASPRTTKFPPLSISTKEFQGAHSFAPKEEVHVEPDCSEYQMNASADNKPVIFMPIGRNKKTELKEKIFDDIKCIASNAFILVKVIANETIEEGVQDVCGDWKGFPQAVREHVETESVSLGVVVFVGDEAKNCETDALVGEFSSKNNLKSLMTVQLLANDSQGFNEAFSLNSHASYTYDNLPKAIVFQNISDSLQVVLRRLNTEIRSSSSGHSLVEESTTREPITYDFASYTMVFSVLVVIVFLLLVSLTAYFDDDEELDYYQMGDDCPSTVAEALQNRHREMQMVHVLSTNANLVPCMSSSRTVESDNNCLSARSGSSDVFNTAMYVPDHRRAHWERRNL